MTNSVNTFKTAAALASVTAAAMLLGTSAVHAQAAPLTDRLVGDVGGAVYSAQGIIRSKGSDSNLLPYGFFDYGRFFARVDTFGVKTLPIGYGYLELVGRVSQDGWRANTAALNGLTNRDTPIPLGIGTFQQTPYGAFIFNAFFDSGKSRGSLIEATYAAEFKLGNVSFYPQIGLERRSAKYTNYLYGVTPAETLASGYATYNAGASTIPVLALAADVPLNGLWVLNMQLREKWLDSAITNSPLASRKMQASGYVALSYRFK
ncbi:MAG: MipA/OmpV family protein [Pseudomonadota bacterium]